MRISVINGPNLNLLGRREPELYGAKTYADLVRFIKQAAEALEIEAMVFQSNHEGAIVDAIQEAYQNYDGIVINAAAYTHTSVAILDALKAVGLPAVEVHLTDISTREDFRRTSYPGMFCFASVMGQGFSGYQKALELLYEHLNS